IAGGLLTQPIPLSGGGTLPALFSVGDPGVFFLDAENVTAGTLGDFTASFASTNVKSEVVAAVPEPPAWLLLLLGGGWVSRGGRRGEGGPRDLPGAVGTPEPPPSRGRLLRAVAAGWRVWCRRG